MLSLVTGVLSFSAASPEGFLSVADLQATSTSQLSITFSDCGSGAHATVNTVTPNVLPLGGSTSFTGAGKNTGEITSSSWTMKMTGVGGVTLLSCSGDDATKPATCNIGLGVIRIGTAKFGGLTFPFESGDITLKDIVTISLPTGLPSFALTTTTTLISTAQDGKQAFCVKIMSKPMADAPPLAEVAPLPAVRVTPTASAAACSADDQTAINAKGPGTADGTFPKITSDCSKSALGIFSGIDETKFNTCLTGAVTGVSTGCSDCFWQAAEYGYKHCKVACLASWCSSSCLECASKFDTNGCAGFVAPQPSPCA